MKTIRANLRMVSLAKMLVEVSLQDINGVLKIREKNKNNSINIWFLPGKIISVTGIKRIVDRVASYNWVKDNLLNSLANESLNNIPIGRKLSKVYNVSSSQIGMLFQEQLKAIYENFHISEGSLEFQEILDKTAFPWSEMTGAEINILDVVKNGLETNFGDRYLDEIPEGSLIIRSTNNKVNVELDPLDIRILGRSDTNKSIREIARDLNIPKLKLQKKIYILKVLGLIEEDLPENKILELASNLSFINKTNKEFEQINFKSNYDWFMPLVTISGVNILLIVLTFLGFFQDIELAMLDRFFRWRGTSVNKDITLVVVDDSDIEKLGNYPISDKQLARAINNLKSHKPLAIGLDIYRDLPQPPGHEDLLEVYRSTDNLIVVEKVVGTKINPPSILAKKDRVGFADLIIDDDGILRRSLISMSTDSGKAKFSLGAYLGLYYLENKGVQFSKINQYKYLIGNTTLESLNDTSGGYYSGDLGGLQTLLNYQSQLEDFHRISFWDLYNDRVSKDLIFDKIIVIGVIADSKKDYVFSPFSRNRSGLAKNMPGMVVHANVTAQLINTVRGKSFLKVLSKKTELSLIFTSSIVVTIFSICLLKIDFNAKDTDKKTIAFIGQNILITGLIIGCSYGLFLNGWWLPTVVPIIGTIVSSVIINSQYKKGLEILMYGDKVTKTANRRYFTKILEQYFADAKATEMDLSLILCRIEGLENFKESQGKKADSFCLNFIARLITQIVGDRGLVARYNQDTMAILFSNLNTKEAEIIVNSINKQTKQINQNNLELSKINLKFGMAVMNEQTDRPLDLIVAADNKLESI